MFGFGKQKPMQDLVDLSGDGAIGTQATLSLRIGSPVNVKIYNGDAQIELDRVKQELESILNDDLSKDDLNTGRSRLENLLLNWK